MISANDILAKFIPTKMIVIILAAVALASCDSPEDRLADHFAEGERLLKAGEHTKASIEFRNALQINPRHAPSIYNLSQAVQASGNFQVSSRLLHQVLDIDPKHFDANIQFGRMLLLSGQVDKALEHSQTAMEIDKGDARAWSLRASILLNLDDAAAALEAARIALDIDENNVEATTVIAASHLANNEPDMAMAVLDRSLAGAGEDNVTLQLFRLTALSRLQDIEGVESLIRKLVQFYPDSAAFRQALVSLLMRLERQDEAEQELRAYAALDPLDLQRQLALVPFMGAAGGLDAALNELKQLVARKDDNQLAYRVQLASLMTNNDKREEAGKVLEEAVANARNDDEILESKTRLALYHMDGASQDRSRQLIDEVLAQDGKYQMGLIARARLSLVDRKIDDAVLDLRTALKDDPESVVALRLLGSAYQLRGDQSLAQESYIRAFQASNGNVDTGLFVASYLVGQRNNARAEDVLTQILQRNQSDLRVWRMLAQTRLALQDWTGAQEVIDHLKQVEDDAAVIGQIEGVAMAGLQRIGDSISAFRRAHDARPDQIRPLVALVNLYMSSNRPAEAEAFLKSVLEAAPDNAQAKVLLSRVYAETERHELASKNYEETIAAQPDQAIGYLSYYRYLNDLGKQDEAAEIIDMGLQTIPGDVPLGLLKGEIIQRSGDMATLAKHFEMLYEQHPDSAIIANNYASILATESDDPADIQKALNVARILDGSSVPQFKDTLGWLHYRMGEYDKALPLLEDAAGKLPELAEIRYHLGMVYEKVGRPRQALAEMEQILYLASENKGGAAAFVAEAEKMVSTLNATITSSENQ